jgi:hypothetical protein
MSRSSQFYKLYPDGGGDDDDDDDDNNNNNNNNGCHAMEQAVSRGAFILKGLVRPRPSLFEINGIQRAMWQFFTEYGPLQVSLSVSFHQCSILIHSLII